MNYVIMITKHHDGFCLWDTKYTEYCVRNSGNKTDVIKEVAKACKKYGIKLGLYYSLWDRSEKTYDLVKRLQPKCQVGINHDVGDDFNQACFPEERYLPENYRENDPLRMFPSDFRLWDPYMCAENDPKIYTYQNNRYYLPFEMTICSREGFSWFYSNIYEDKPLLDVDEICKNCEIIFKNQNMAVINIPPNTDGKLVEADREHLFAIADKLKIRRK